jgi:hypothetical protein
MQGRSRGSGGVLFVSCFPSVVLRVRARLYRVLLP